MFEYCNCYLFDVDLFWFFKDGDVWVSGDCIMICEVVFNFIDNVLCYGGLILSEVFVVYEIFVDSVLIVIIDNGVGLIFEEIKIVC